MWRADTRPLILSHVSKDLTLVFADMLQGVGGRDILHRRPFYRRDCSISYLTKREDFVFCILCSRIIILLIKKLARLKRIKIKITLSF